MESRYLYHPVQIIEMVSRYLYHPVQIIEMVSRIIISNIALQLNDLIYYYMYKTKTILNKDQMYVQ